MAQSRLEKIGTIFTRTTGLLRAGALKAEDKPIWYDVYAAFPPKLEPRYDRPAANIPIRSIFYKEDEIRAKFHKSVKYQDMVNLADTKRETAAQQFIQIYQELVAQGPLDQEQVFETAQNMLAEKRQQSKSESTSNEVFEAATNTKASSNLLSEFNEATQAKQVQSDTEKHKSNNKGINIENLFKD